MMILCVDMPCNLKDKNWWLTLENKMAVIYMEFENLWIELFVMLNLSDEFIS